MLFSDCGPPQENPRKDVCLHDCHDQTRGERVEQGELKGSVMDIRYPARYLDIQYIWTSSIPETGLSTFGVYPAEYLSKCLVSGRILWHVSGIRLGMKFSPYPVARYRSYMLSGKFVTCKDLERGNEDHIYRYVSFFSVFIFHFAFLDNFKGYHIWGWQGM